MAHLIDTNLLLRRQQPSHPQDVWRQFIAAKDVSGKQVHDARLVAFMLVHGVTHILTFNGSDFRRFEALPPEIGPGIVVVNPSDV